MARKLLPHIMLHNSVPATVFSLHLYRTDDAGRCWPEGARDVCACADACVCVFSVVSFNNMASHPPLARERLIYMHVCSTLATCSCHQHPLSSRTLPPVTGGGGVGEC